MELEVFPTPEALATAAAEHFVTVAGAAIRTSGRCVVALSGGATPAALYGKLASDAYRARVAWSRLHIFWGDERVTAENAETNAGMARETLLDLVDVPGENVHRMQVEDGPADAAAAYERELRTAFATPLGAPHHVPGMRFDLVLLGLGADGHTASLFPGMHAASEGERWVVAEYIPTASMWRVTLTPVVINAAAEIVFVVAGSAKASVLQRVLEGPRNVEQLPAQAIAPEAGRLRWLVDAAAAANLRRTGAWA